jgi:hypothetical protein
MEIDAAAGAVIARRAAGGGLMLTGLAALDDGLVVPDDLDGLRLGH